MNETEGFDAARFEKLVTRLREEAQRKAPTDRPVEPQPLAAADLQAMPQPGTPLHAECVRLGEEALRRGEVSVVILVGGAATRFGGAT